MLYWGEGDKTKNYFIALTNTNPNILIYFVTWFRRYFDIDERKLKCRLYIWKNINEKNVKSFWSKKLNIPLEQFTKSYISNSLLKIRKNRHEFGVCRVSYGSKKIFGEIIKQIDEHFV